MIILAIVVFAVLYSVRMQPAQKPTVTIGSTAVAVELAATPAARELGLSGHAPLADNEGMLFLFPRDNRDGFWMKDMLFPLDIIWADSAGKVITIWRSLSPNTYPQAFYPTAPARYVLEVPAGFAMAHNIATGTLMIIPPSIPPALQ